MLVDEIQLKGYEMSILNDSEIKRLVVLIQNKTSKIDEILTKH